MLKINAKTEVTNSTLNENSLSKKLEKNLKLTPTERDEKTLAMMQITVEENRSLFLRLRKKVDQNYKVTENLYIISFVFGLGLLFFTFMFSFLGVISLENSIVGGAAGLIELSLLFVFKPIEKIHEIISDFAQITIITNSYQQQVNLRLVQMKVEDRESLGVAATEINLAAKNASEMIQNYCEIKSPDQSKMIQEFINKIQEFFKKKDKATSEKK